MSEDAIDYELFKALWAELQESGAAIEMQALTPIVRGLRERLLTAGLSIQLDEAALLQKGMDEGVVLVADQNATDEYLIKGGRSLSDIRDDPFPPFTKGSVEGW